MTSEPLQPIADAVKYEAARLAAAHGLPLGVVVTVDERAGTVTASGPGLREPGLCLELAATLARNGLRHDVLTSAATIVVHPSAA